jgi:DNA-binding response OmpR family regulator
MEPANILVIEDDYIVARTIERSLRSDEFNVILSSRGDKGLHLARQNPPDLVILDIVMPDMDGYSVCENMRGDPKLAETPILFLTARVKPEDRIAGFRAGADDYLCKPFNVDELILRIQAILRRTRPYSNGAVRQLDFSPPHCLVVGEYTLDTQTFELHTPSRGKIRLTPLQYDLLYHLMTHPGEPFSPARLLDEVWDYPSGRGSPDLVRVHIKTLRERIENDPRAPTFICTIPGRGYTVHSVMI